MGVFFFFFNDTATTEIYTLSLHDALPIWLLISSSGWNDWRREMNLKNRLSKLEKTKRQITTEADCICFPPDEPSHLELKAEIEAAKAVHCPRHGERFSKLR